MLLINWIRVKRKELKLKLQLLSIADDIDKYSDFIKRLVESCEGKSGEKLRKEVIAAVAEEVHKDNKNELPRS